jgi:hypothetical protein
LSQEKKISSDLYLLMEANSGQKENGKKSEKNFLKNDDACTVI